MNKDDIRDSLRALANDDSVRSETARLRDIFDDIEAAIAAGVKIPAILETLHKKGFKMSLAGFRSAIQRIRKEREAHPELKIPAITPKEKTIEQKKPNNPVTKVKQSYLPFIKKSEVNLEDYIYPDDED